MDKIGVFFFKSSGESSVRFTTRRAFLRDPWDPCEPEKQGCGEHL